jgi:MFS family permease
VSGGSVGLVVGGLVTQFISWRWTLFINVPIGAAVLLLAPRLVAEADRRRNRFDVVGALSAVRAATGLVHAVTEAPSKCVVLAHTESRVPDPVVRLGQPRCRNKPRTPELWKNGVNVARVLALPQFPFAP